MEKKLNQYFNSCMASKYNYNSPVLEFLEFYQVHPKKTFLHQKLHYTHNLYLKFESLNNLT